MSEKKMSKMFCVGTRPYPECIVKIRDNQQEAEDEATRLNDALGRENFIVLPALVHFLREENNGKTKKRHD